MTKDKKMSEIVQEMREKIEEYDKLKQVFPRCPECDASLVVVGRCKTCYNCGWSSCDL